MNLMYVQCEMSVTYMYVYEAPLVTCLQSCIKAQDNDFVILKSASKIYIYINYIIFVLVILVYLIIL